MFRTKLLLALLLITPSLNAQWFYKLKVTSDAYGIPNINSSKINNIYVENDFLEMDLSLRPYLQKIKMRLIDMGYTTASNKSKSDFVLHFNVFSEGITEVIDDWDYEPSDVKTITKTNSEGKEEKITVKRDSRFISNYVEKTFYKKKLIMTLRQRNSDRLIWQSLTFIIDENEFHADYANYLVYDAMRNFLLSTEQHPQEAYYANRHRKRIHELFSPYSQFSRY